MNPEKRAVIDIGTNSVKLLLAEVQDLSIRPLEEDSRQTRLGRGFYQDHRLRPDAIAQTAEAVAEFAQRARQAGASRVRVIATSAARDAVNSHELLEAIRQASGLEVEIISGQQEAKWAFQGVLTDPQLALHPLLILDIGGGSSEFVLGQGGEVLFEHSFNLGTVRLLEQLSLSDPPTAAEREECRRQVRTFLRGQVSPALQPILHRYGQAHLVGTGGTATILARIEGKLTTFDPAQIEAVRLSRAQVQALEERLWGMRLEQRQNLVGLPPKRADVILTGASIFASVLEEFQLPELRVSTRGLRYAAMLG